MNTTRAVPNAAATVPVALHAITGHMIEHRLPAPHDIDTRSIRDRGIQLWVYSYEADRWLDSGFVEVDRTVRRQDNPRATWETVDVDGTLPSAVGDIKVRLTFVRPVAGRLLKVAGDAR